MAGTEGIERTFRNDYGRAFAGLVHSFRDFRSLKADYRRHAARADFLARMGDIAAAGTAFTAAVDGCTNAAERARLERKPEMLQTSEPVPT